ncbi:hypothetical protein TMatcc_009097 [Talaromyces marneffei ATCC 18224]
MASYIIGHVVERKQFLDIRVLYILLLGSKTFTNVINSYLLKKVMVLLSAESLVVDVVTVSCLLACHPIVPPKSVMTYACELLRSSVLSANEASVDTEKSSPPPSLKAWLD